MAKSESFPRHRRLRRQTDFDRLFNHGSTFVDQQLVLTALANEQGCTRLGISIPRAVGNAVTRNRWKRSIREAFRSTHSHLPQGLDLIARPRKGAVPEFLPLCRSLTQLANQAGARLLSTRPG